MSVVLRVAFLALTALLWMETTAQAGTCSKITDNEITFHFDAAYECGQFVNGEWWIVPAAPGGKITLTQLDPSPYSSGCNSTGHDGWEVNPPVNQNFEHSFDDRVKGANFVSPPCLPYDVQAGESVVKVKSWDKSWTQDACKADSNTSSCVDTAAILTVLDAPAPADAFRPPYVRGPKPMFRTGDLNLSRLSKLPQHPKAMSLEATAAMFTGPWLDHIQGFHNRYIHPRRGMNDHNGVPADYGAEILRLTSMMAMRTMHDDPDSEKMPVVIPLVQAGIDLYHMLLAGKNWKSLAGHENGRKLPILYTGLLLDHPGMLGIGTTHVQVQNDCAKVFSEDGQTFFGENGVALWGDQRKDYCGCEGKYGGGGDPRGDYYDNFNGDNCGGRKTCRDPDGWNDGGYRVQGPEGSQCKEQRPPAEQIADASWGQSSYQHCCTTTGFIGTSIAARLLGLKDEWNHEPFFVYSDRMAGPPWNGAGGYGHSYMSGMHADYLHCAGSCPGQPGVSPDGTVPPFVH